jgi:hypothetical protein
LPPVENNLEKSLDKAGLSAGERPLITYEKRDFSRNSNICP